MTADGAPDPAGPPAGAAAPESAAPVPPAPADVTAPVAALLDRLERTVVDARALPMSASCVVNRSEVLGLVADLRRALPEALRRASDVLGDRDGVVAEGRNEAQRLLAEAEARRGTMVSRTEVHRAARDEAQRVLEEARAEADAMRAEVEEYVDAKLANFEVVLTKTLGAVQRGRARLHGESELDDLGDALDGRLGAGHGDADARPLPGG